MWEILAEGAGFDSKNDILLFARSVRNVAEGAGFEPVIGVTYAGFQDQCLKPLGHPSIYYYTTLSPICKNKNSPFLSKSGIMLKV